MKLKDFFNEILNESPPSPNIDGNILDNMYKDPVELKGKLINGEDEGIVTVGGNKYRLYIENIPSGLEYAFLNLERTKILAAHAFKEKIFKGKLACFNDMVWNAPENKGFILKWLDEVILKKYDYFISADKISIRGMIFWEKLFKLYVEQKNTHVFEIYNTSNGSTKKISDFNEAKQYRKDWGDEKYLFVLKKL